MQNVFLSGVPKQIGYTSPSAYACDPNVICPNRNFDPRMSTVVRSIPIVQEWNPLQVNYSASIEYTLDPIDQKISTLCSSKLLDAEYSSINKSFYQVVPSNTHNFQSPAAKVHFDITELRQTNVLDFISSQNSHPYLFGIVSLVDTISPLINRMGTMEDTVFEDKLGTCTLITHDLVIVARHAVEGRNIQNIRVSFGYTYMNGTFYQAGHTSFKRVVEENVSCDYAIVQLNNPLGKDLGFVLMNFEAPMLAEPALLHYPLGKPLQISVHAFVQTEYQSERLLVYHDSDIFSSGGAYFDPMGCMIAMHLGAELQDKSMNQLRYAIPLELIVRRNPNSLLAKIAKGELLQATDSYHSHVNLYYLAPTDHDYLIDEEGTKSEIILRGLLKNEVKTDTSIIKTSKGKISFSQENLSRIAKKYDKQYKQFVKECLGKTGKHGITHLYSITGVIESDHTLPHSVWAKTTNPKMKKHAKGKGARPGENGMPAITLPWEIHRIIRTTGGVKGHEAFIQSLISLCNNNKIDEAIIKCYEEYEDKGLLLFNYEDAIKNSLEDHVTLGVITTVEKNAIISKFF